MRLFLSELEAPALELTHLIKMEPFFISLYSILYGNVAAHCVTVIELWLLVLDDIPEKRLLKPCFELFDTTLLDPFEKRFELCWICWINC